MGKWFVENLTVNSNSRLEIFNQFGLSYTSGGNTYYLGGNIAENSEIYILRLNIIQDLVI